jgi:Cft2 family RNA processing exonuclease
MKQNGAAMSGGRELVDLCTSITKSLNDGADPGIPDTNATISTRKSKFSPVLLAYLLRLSDIELDPQNAPIQIRRAWCLLDILDDLKYGKLTTSKDLASALNRSVLEPKNTPVFDLMYGALQMLVYAKITGAIQENEAQELFDLCCGMAYTLMEHRGAGMISHIDHFRVHAAVYLAHTEMPDEDWERIHERTEEILSSWGDPPVHQAVILHAAQNLCLTIKNLPFKDYAYDFVKALRRSVEIDHSISPEAAFDIINDSLGWHEASSIIKVLWMNRFREYYEYCRNKVAAAAESESQQRAVQYAYRISFVGSDGYPLIPGAYSDKNGRVSLYFPGGSTIGKSSVMIRQGSKAILLDFGCTPYGRTPEWLPELDFLEAVFITHAHQDHIGGLLRLYGKLGYDGYWYAHELTRDLAELTLTDSVKIMKERLQGKCPYSPDSVKNIIGRFRPIESGKEMQVNGFRVSAFNAGHVIGSYQYIVGAGDNTILYTGDFNTEKCLSAPPLDMPLPEIQKRVDTVVFEGTYAFREEGITNSKEAAEELIELIRTQDSYPVLVPVLSLGRSQEVVSILADEGLRVGVFGLASKMTLAVTPALEHKVYLHKGHLDNIDPRDFDVLVASAGCLQSGPSRVFYKDWRLKPIPVILTGYLFPGTPARAMADRLPRVRFSAHAPYHGWANYMNKFSNARNKFMIHYPGIQSLPDNDLIIPRMGKGYPLCKRDESCI